MDESKYEKSGVSIDRGNEAVERIKGMVKKMGVKEIGKFGGFFPLPGGMDHPILVSSADGVGTKLKIAFMSGVHHTVGRDLVNHCVNDILVYGAKPLFFLDYIAMGKLEPGVVEKLVGGVLDGCVGNGFVLLGGETAEMPGFYQPGEYDVAGFIVGLVEKDRVVDGASIVPGDLMIGLPSLGLHTNGYSLARHIVFEKLGLKHSDRVEELGTTVGEALLAPHRSYLAPVTPLLERGLIKGMAHITGGGLLENVPRVLPESVAVTVEKTWQIPPLFAWLCREGGVDEREAFRVFNMGIGMVLFIARENLSAVDEILRGLGEVNYLIGQAVEAGAGDRVSIRM